MEMKEAKRIAREIKKNCKKLKVWENTLLTADATHVTPQEFIDMIKKYDTQEVICYPAPAGETTFSIYHVGFIDETNKVEWYSTTVVTDDIKPQSMTVPIMVPTNKISLHDRMESAAKGKV